MGSLLYSNLLGLWLGKATAHCSHHLSLQQLTQERVSNESRGLGVEAVDTEEMTSDTVHDFGVNVYCELGEISPKLD